MDIFVIIAAIVIIIIILVIIIMMVTIDPIDNRAVDEAMEEIKRSRSILIRPTRPMFALSGLSISQYNKLSEQLRERFPEIGITDHVYSRFCHGQRHPDIDPTKIHFIYYGEVYMDMHYCYHTEPLIMYGNKPLEIEPMSEFVQFCLNHSSRNL